MNINKWKHLYLAWFKFWDFHPLSEKKKENVFLSFFLLLKIKSSFIIVVFFIWSPFKNNTLRKKKKKDDENCRGFVTICKNSAADADINRLFCLFSFITFLSFFLSFSSIIIILLASTSIGWWSFTGVWATVSLLRSPGLFSVFWPNLTVQ